MDTLAAQLSQQTLQQITEHFDLDEVRDESGGPFLALQAAPFGNAPAGSMRVWDGGERLLKVVYTGITVAPIGLDSHMIFAFTQPDSLVPTFTLDSVYTKMPPGMDPNFPDGGDMYSFHLDLVQRCDLGVNDAYMQRCYAPLTESQASVLAAEGVYPAQLSPRQRAIMSPWMLAQRTTPGAYESSIFPAAAFYLEHWLKLVDDGVTDAGIVGAAGRERDAANRSLIFNREIDPVWEKIDGLLGAEVSDYMISVLRSQSVERRPEI